MNNNAEKYSVEMFQLALMLLKADDCFSIEMTNHLGGWRLGICLGKRYDRRYDFCDVICNDASYGHQDGLLEGYMGPFVTECDEVAGWLTANEAFAKILAYTIDNTADIVVE